MHSLHRLSPPAPWRRMLPAAAALTLAALIAGACSPRRNSGNQPGADAPRAERVTGETRVEIGFGIGPLARADHYDAALRQIKADGFRYIRAYEPFRARGSGSVQSLIPPLQHLDAMGFTIYLGLSNFPASLAPTSTPQTPGLWAAARRNAESAHTNRYPPTAQQFDSLLGALLQTLDATFGREKLRTWLFEVGNEPDAPKFFWGTPDDFRGLLQRAVSRFEGYDPGIAIGGGAFTHGLVRNASKSSAYAGVARALATRQGSFVSVHFYAQLTTGRDIGSDINGLLGPPNGRRRVISEWNVSTQPDRPTTAVLNAQNDIGPYLIDLLAGAAEAGVELVLIHKLQDERGDDEELGYFDMDGRPKPSYALVQRAAAFARQGFSVTRGADGSVRLIGADQTWIEAGDAPIALDQDADVIAPGALRQIPAHGWALVRSRR